VLQFSDRASKEFTNKAWQNTVAADPTGKGYCSGGEDGYVRLHHFDKAYFDFSYEVERERMNNA